MVSFSEKEIEEAISLFEAVNPMYKEFYKSSYEKKAMAQIISALGFEETKKLLISLPEIVSKKFAPKITRPTELKRDVGKLILFTKQEKDPSHIRGIEL